MASSDDIPLRCWAELDAHALRHNAAVARAQGGADIVAMVKANAYGHGAVWAARTLEDLATLYGVANLREATELRAAGIAKPILLLSPCLEGELATAVREGFHLSVASPEGAVVLDGVARALGVKAHAHLVVDTGMGRIGFLEEEWGPAAIAAVVALEHLVWEGITTHLPSPDEDAAYTRGQIERFRRVVEVAHANGLRPRHVHLANSAGLLGYPEQRDWCDLTRPGLMLYGVSPLPEEQARLRPVLKWKTRVSVVRRLPAGHGVSYGRTFITDREMSVATLACGYADGYPRQASGHGAAVLIRGVRCPLLGRVTMDQMMVDVSALGEAVVAGDEVVLIGCQGEESISAAEVATWSGTIAWHVFTGIGGRVQRVEV